MKQEIVCEKCRPELRALFKTDTPYPGEHVKFVDGKARETFICDQCGQLIKAKDNCTAFSSWADYGGIPYYNWESGCIYDFEEQKEVNNK